MQQKIKKIFKNMPDRKGSSYKEGKRRELGTVFQFLFKDFISIVTRNTQFFGNGKKLCP